MEYTTSSNKEGVQEDAGEVRVDPTVALMAREDPHHILSSFIVVVVPSSYCTYFFLKSLTTRSGRCSAAPSRRSPPPPFPALRTGSRSVRPTGPKVLLHLRCRLRPGDGAGTLRHAPG